MKKVKDAKLDYEQIIRSADYIQEIKKDIRIWKRIYYSLDENTLDVVVQRKLQELESVIDERLSKLYLRNPLLMRDLGDITINDVTHSAIRSIKLIMNRSEMRPKYYKEPCWTDGCKTPHLRKSEHVRTNKYRCKNENNCRQFQDWKQNAEEYHIFNKAKSSAPIYDLAFLYHTLSKHVSKEDKKNKLYKEAWELLKHMAIERIEEYYTKLKNENYETSKQ